MSDELRDIELVEITPDELEIFANIEAEELNINVEITETGPPGPPGDITQEVFNDTINALDGRVQANTDAVGVLDGRVQANTDSIGVLDGRVGDLEALAAKIEYASGTETEPTGAWSTGTLTDVTGFHWQRVTIGGVMGEPELVEKPLTGVGRNLFIRANLKTLAWVNIGSKIETDPRYRGYYFKGKQDANYLIQKYAPITSRFGVYISSAEPVAGTPVDTVFRDDNAFSANIKTGVDQEWVFIYLSPSSEVVGDLYITEGTTATPWQPAPEDTHTITPVVRDGRLTSHVTYGDYVMPTAEQKLRDRVTALEQAVADGTMAITALGGTIL